ncbi:MAG TPA: hypothetical protein PKD45_10985 [Flavobacteriales bacterium]|nr:hypothetical protein [Flavobacteriales bacterium]
MKRLSQLAPRIFIALQIAVLIFHGMILLKVIPYTIAWGGKLESDAAMYRYEAVAILMNAALLSVLLIKAKAGNANERFMNSILWVFVVIFILNTIGNLMAKTTAEKLLSIISGISALLALMVIRGGQKAGPKLKDAHPNEYLEEP